MLTYKNATAYAVLSILFDLLGEDKSKELYVEPFLNGSECGFKVFLSNKHQVAFAENRDTRSIIAYYGGITDFDARGNTPTNYQPKYVTFRHSQYLNAAEWVKGYIERID